MSTRKIQIIGNLTKVDETFTQAGYAADAKATGDAISQVQTSIDEFTGVINGLDSKYYTETEIDSMTADLNAAIDSKSDSDHSHDDTYYTETEIDAKFSTMLSDIDSKVDTVDNKIASLGIFADTDDEGVLSFFTNTLTDAGEVLV